MTKNSRSWTMVAAVLAALGWGCVAPDAGGVEPIERTEQPLFVSSGLLWPSSSIPICWDQEEDQFPDERAWVRDQIIETWEIESKVRFTGWEDCASPTAPGIHIFFAAERGNSAVGTNLDGQSGEDGLQLNTWTQDDDCGEGWTRERCVRATATHEFGHALAFRHEHKRTNGKPADCTEDAGGVGDLEIGPWDRDSVMNYCNPLRNGDGRPSGTDIWGLGNLYGHQRPIGASTWGGATMRAVIRGPDNDIWSAFSNDGVTWGSLTSLGGDLSSAPSLVSWGSNRLDLFGRGTDGAVWHKTWTFAGGWTGWTSRGGFIKGRPMAVSWGANRIDLIARGRSDGLFHAFYNGANWTGWSGIGDDVVGEPAVVSRASGHLSVFARARDNTLRHRAYANGSWGAWESLGGNLADSPTAASRSATTLDVVVRWTDNTIRHRFWNGSTWTANWATISGGAHTGVPVVTSRTANVLDIFSRRTDGAIWQISWTGSAWTNWFSRGGNVLGSPEVKTNGANRIDIFAEGTDHGLFVRGWNGSSWGAWTRIAGANIQ